MFSLIMNQIPGKWKSPPEELLLGPPILTLLLENSDKVYKEKFFSSLIKQSNFLSKNLNKYILSTK